jgi:hypothetical protein
MKRSHSDAVLAACVRAAAAGSSRDTAVRDVVAELDSDLRAGSVSLLDVERHVTECFDLALGWCARQRLADTS